MGTGTNLATNFNYNGREYLDSRQNRALTKDELKNWKILIPSGFQVYVDGEWYTYLPDIAEDPKTGKFHKFFSDSLDSRSENTGLNGKVVAEEFDKVYDKYDNLYKRVYPLQWLWCEGGSFVEAGDSITPEIIWNVGRNGEEIIPDSVLINGSREGIQPDNKKFIAPAPIKVDTSYEVKVTQNGESLSHIFDYIFTVPRYYGVSEYSEMTSDRVLGLGFSDWAQCNFLRPQLFNCSGGKYPWICIPSELWEKNPPTDIWVEGIHSGDVESFLVNVKNKYGVTKEYTCFRLGHIQTGTLKIELR